MGDIYSDKCILFKFGFCWLSLSILEQTPRNTWCALLRIWEVLTYSKRRHSLGINVEGKSRQKLNKQEIRSVELGVCPMQLFHFWSCDVHPVQNLLLCTKFHQNRIIFRWDMAIYRFLKPGRTTSWNGFTTIRDHPQVSIAGHSCLSNFMSMWYTDLKI